MNGERLAFATLVIAVLVAALAARPTPSARRTMHLAGAKGRHPRAADLARSRRRR